jgi:hypothetical protein
VLVSRDARGGVEGVFVETEAHLVGADAAEGCEVAGLRVVVGEVFCGGTSGRGLYCG